MATGGWKLGVCLGLVLRRSGHLVEVLLTADGEVDLRAGDPAGRVVDLDEASLFARSGVMEWGRWRTAHSQRKHG